MNTIIKLQYSSTFRALKDAPEDKTLSEDVYEFLVRRFPKGLALILSPATLHARGEIYVLSNTKWFSTWLGVKDTDLILPRGLLDEQRRLETDGWCVFLVRTPSVGSGSMDLLLDPDLMLASLPADGVSPSSKKRKPRN